MKVDFIKTNLGKLLDYIQPTKFIVKSTNYNDNFKTPVLTPGKSFIKGYTNETEGIFSDLPVIIFDDFTTASRFVNFPFKVKSSAMKILKPTSELVNMKYVFYMMQVLNVRSDTHKRYWISIYSKKEIPFPPLPIQRAIVSKIEQLFSELDNGIQNLQQAKEKLAVFRQAVLKKAFEGGLTGSKMKELKLDDITSKLGDGLHGTPNYSEKGDYYFINGNNLNDGKIFIKSNTKRVGREEFEKYKKPLNSRTVFVSINGTIGNTAFYNNEPVVLGKSACYFNLLDDFDKKYVRYNLKTSRFINYAFKNATGSTIKNVGLKTMRNYSIPFPVQESDQVLVVQEIESRLSVCDEMEKSIERSLTKAEALRQSILKKAFEGELLTEKEIDQCKQEPDWETAEELLERIEKENNKTKK